MARSEAVLKPGWLAEELAEAGLHGAENEIVAAELALFSAKSQAALIVEQAQSRLNRAYLAREQARAALARHAKLGMDGATP